MVRVTLGPGLKCACMSITYIKSTYFLLPKLHYTVFGTNWGHTGSYVTWSEIVSARAAQPLQVQVQVSVESALKIIHTS